MASVGPAPEWYITQRLVFTTRPLARCGKPSQLINLTLFSLAWASNIQYISSRKIIFVGLEQQWYIT